MSIEYLNKICGNPGFVDGATIPPFASKAALDASGSGWEIGTIANAAGVPYSWGGAGLGWIAAGGDIAGKYVGGSTGDPTQLSFVKIGVEDAALFDIDDGLTIPANLDSARTWTTDTSEAGGSFVISGGFAAFSEVTVTERRAYLRQALPPFSAVWSMEDTLSIGSGDVATLGIRSKSLSGYILFDISQTGWAIRYYGTAAGATQTGSYAFGANPRVRVGMRRSILTISAYVNGAWIIVVSYGGMSQNRFTGNNYLSVYHYDWSSYQYCIGTNTVATGPVTHSNIVFEHPRPLGIRDQQLVTYSDGTPYIIGDDIYMTATCGADAVAGDGIASSWAVVLRVNRNTMCPTITGYIRVFRKPYAFPTAIAADVGDSPIKIVREDATDTWHLFASTFGDSGSDPTYNRLNINYCKFSGNPLHGAVSVSVDTPQFINLKSDNVIAYDADLIYYRGYWHMTYASANTYGGYGQRLYYRRAGSILGLRDASDVLLPGGGGEGPKFLLFGGALYIITSSKSVVSVVDGGVTSAGSITIDVAGMTMPHFCIYPVPSRDGTVFQITTFDQTPVSGNFSWGMWHKYRSQVIQGVERL